MKKSLLLLFVSWMLFMASSARGQDTLYRSESLTMSRLTHFVYLYTSTKHFPEQGNTGANGIIILINGQAILVELPWDDGHTGEVIALIKDSLRAELLIAVVTHAHNDRIGGINLLKELDIPVYALESTTLLAKEINIPRPDIIFEDTLAIYFQGHELLLYFPGPGHSSDNLMIWMPSEKLLYAGCYVRALEDNSLGDMTDARPAAWAITLPKAMQRFQEAYYVIPGFGAPGGMELMEHTMKLLAEYLSTQSAPVDGKRD